MPADGHHYLMEVFSSDCPHQGDETSRDVSEVEVGMEGSILLDVRKEVHAKYGIDVDQKHEKASHIG